MIKARVIPKSWLANQGRSSEWLWNNGFRPEVHRTHANDDTEVRLWRLPSSAEGQGGHTVDLFIDKEDLLQEAALAYGGLSNLAIAIAHRMADEVVFTRHKVKRLNKRVENLQDEKEELEAKVADYVKKRAAGI